MKTTNKVTNIGIIIKNNHHTFKVSKVSKSQDPCEICLKQGLGKYSINNKINICSYIDVCMIIMKDHKSEAYLKEITRNGS